MKLLSYKEKPERPTIHDAKPNQEYVRKNFLQEQDAKYVLGVISRSKEDNLNMFKFKVRQEIQKSIDKPMKKPTEECSFQNDNQGNLTSESGDWSKGSDKHSENLSDDSEHQE